MKEKSTTEKGGYFDPRTTASNIFTQVTKNYEHGLHNVLKLQEEALQCCTNALNTPPNATELQKQFNEFAKSNCGVLPVTKKHVTELFELAEKNTRTAAELLTKALEATKTTDPAQSGRKWNEFWTASLDATRANAESFNKLASQTVDSTLECFQKNAECFESHTAKAA